jgi:hypothetical protein
MATIERARAFPVPTSLRQREMAMRLLIASILSVLAFTPSYATQTSVGDLICTLSETGERGVTPPSQTRAMFCTFKPAGGGPEERYSGEIKSVGSHSELSGKLVLIWAVMGPPDRKLEPGLLEQTYVGQHETDDPDEPPRMLVGERNDSYALRLSSDDKADSGTITVVILKVQSIPT